MKKQALVPVEEAKGFIDEEDLEMIEQPSREVIELIQAKIELIDDQIKKIIDSD